MKFQVWNSRSFINNMTYPYIRQGDFQMIPGIISPPNSVDLTVRSMFEDGIDRVVIGTDMAAATDMKGDMICSD